MPGRKSAGVIEEIRKPLKEKRKSDIHYSISEFVTCGIPLVRAGMVMKRGAGIQWEIIVATIFISKGGKDFRQDENGVMSPV